MPVEKPRDEIKDRTESPKGQRVRPNEATSVSAIAQANAQRAAVDASTAPQQAQTKAEERVDADPDKLSPPEEKGRTSVPSTIPAVGETRRMGVDVGQPTNTHTFEERAEAQAALNKAHGGVDVRDRIAAKEQETRDALDSVAEEREEKAEKDRKAGEQQAKRETKPPSEQ